LHLPINGRSRQRPDVFSLAGGHHLPMARVLLLGRFLLESSFGPVRLHVGRGWAEMGAAGHMRALGALRALHGPESYPGPQAVTSGWAAGAGRLAGWHDLAPCWP
jgi:hypothetical protein